MAYRPLLSRSEKEPDASLDRPAATDACSLFVRYDDFVAKWCTVTVIDSKGKRYSLDVQATSSYDAAHLYLTHVAGHPGCGMPIPTTRTLFEVVAAGKILHVEGVRLKAWIERRRSEWNGPRGFLFSQRPSLEN